jgi:6,7-dimethyl-8-ribityllumazine synthase
MNKQVKTVYEGVMTAKGLKLGIVCARFNELFTSKLLDGAIDAFVRHGGSADDISVAWVPGSFETPLIAKRLAVSGTVDAVIALGLVVQGNTSHANHINSQVASSLAGIGCDTGIPVIYGVVTTETLEQAMERCGTKHGNRGAEAAKCAIEMANLIKDMG